MNRLGREHLLPFLVVAYPATFALLQTRPYCGPDCGPFSVADVLALVAVVAGSLLASVLVVRPLLARTLDGPGSPSGPTANRVRSPSGPTVTVLVGAYLAFVAFLALDVANVAEALWKPVLLPASLLPFAPVWALYAATFYLALVFQFAGVGPSSGLTLVVRSVVVLVGFGTAPIWQFFLVSGLLGRRPRRNEDGPP